jgi:hypothetical protein
MPTPEQARIAAMLNKRHPEYTANLPEWNFMEASVTGGPGYVSGNLYQHALEELEVYRGRALRARDQHYNISGLVVDSYEGYLCQEPPIVSDAAPSCIAAYAARATDEGSTLEDFSKEVTRDLLKYGILYIVTDKPAIDVDRELSAAEDMALGNQPYSYVVHPQNLLDGKIVNGQFVWAIIRETAREDETPESPGNDVIQYRVWECDRIRVYKEDPNEPGCFILVSEVPNGYGIVPIARVAYNKNTKGFACPGLISDIAHMDRAIFNMNSLQDEINYKATFPQLAIPYDGKLFTTNEAGEETLSGAGEQILKMGLESFIPYSSVAGAPAYLNYPDGPSKDLREAVKGKCLAAFALAFLDGENGVEEVHSTGSGVSKSYTFQKLNKRLSAISDVIESAFLAVFRIICVIQGVNPEALPEGAIDFPDTFEIKSLTQEITDIIALLGSGLKSQTFSIEVFKRLVRLAFPKMDEDILAQIDEEIEAGVSDEYQMQELSATAQAAGLAASATQSTAAAAGVDPAGIVKSNSATGVRTAEKDNSENGGGRAASL